RRARAAAAVAGAGERRERVLAPAPVRGGAVRGRGHRRDRSGPRCESDSFPLCSDGAPSRTVPVLEPFQLPFVQRALVEVALLAAVAGALGCWIVLRGLAFSTHGVAA